MQNVTLVGIDLGKDSFHLHGQDKAGKAVFRRKVSRKQLVEFFATRNESQQILSALHRIRRALVRDRVRTRNQMHGFLLEFGISLPVGHGVVKRLPVVLAEHQLPPRLIAILERLHDHFKYLTAQISDIEKELERQLAEDALGQRLLTIPGVGSITASLLASELGDGKQYRCSRDFAAAVGLVPRQYSTGGKSNLLGISKRGDKNIRHLLVQCARAFMLHLDKQTGCMADWVRAMLARRHSNVVACALANKLARIAWAISSRNTVFERRTAVTAA